MSSGVRSKIIQFISATVMIGLCITGIDRYFGKGTGKLGEFILGTLVFGGLIFGYFLTIHPLYSPRALDTTFVGCSDYARRKRLAKQLLRTSLLRQTWVPLGALLVFGLLLPLGPLEVAGAATAMAFGSLSISLLMIASVKFGWIRLSRKKFHAREGGISEAFGPSAISLLIRGSDVAARTLSTWMTGPEKWMLRRKLLYLTRTDPIYLFIHVILTLVLSIQFNITWNFNLSAVFTLVNLVLSLTLLQLAFRVPDANFIACAFFMPPSRVDSRATLFLFLSIAFVLLAAFTIGCVAHMGLHAAIGYRAFWQVLGTGMGLTFLLGIDLPWKVGIARSDWQMNSRMIRNFCYLGLAGWLFMLSWAGLVVTGVVLIGAAGLCVRHSRG
jgi:hypothetical protein